VRRFSNLKKTPGDFVLPSAPRGPIKRANGALFDVLKDIRFDYRPFGVVGCLCSGKSATIEHFQFTYDKFVRIIPYKSPKTIQRGESEGYDYHRREEANFDEADPSWLFIEKQTTAIAYQQP
jgi:hypothetical protein